MPNVTIYLPKELMSVWKKIKNKSAWMQSQLKKEETKGTK